MRTMPWTLASLTLLPALLAATAAAEAASCPASYVTVDAAAAGHGILYVGDDGSVWQETNGLRGLQCSPVVMGGRVFAPDTRILG